MEIQIDPNAGEHMHHCNALLLLRPDAPSCIPATLKIERCSLAKGAVDIHTCTYSKVKHKEMWTYCCKFII